LERGQLVHISVDILVGTAGKNIIIMPDGVYYVYSIAGTLSSKIYEAIPWFCVDLLCLISPTGVSLYSSII
jgi:hypothetical protein